MSTPHIDANLGEIAKTVIMPGDPLRAKKMAKSLDKARLVSKARNNFCYTGTYKGVKLSIMSSGMGSGSMGIYSHELFETYNVQNIIRVGTIGSLNPNIKIGDVIVGEKIDSDSNYGDILVENKTQMSCSPKILSHITSIAKEKNAKVALGKIFSTDTFYAKSGVNDELSRKGFLGVEMECSALYKNAIDFGRHAICLCTVTDELLSGKRASSRERQNNFSQVFSLALDVAITL